jgi:hypothetical protein
MLIMGKVMHIWGKELMGNTYLPLDFAMNLLKLLQSKIHESKLSSDDKLVK